MNAADRNAQAQLNQDRRRLVSLLTEQARRAWLMGRSDRVAGYPMAIKWASDPYYRAGYERERRKEVEAVAA